MGWSVSNILTQWSVFIRIWNIDLNLNQRESTPFHLERRRTYWSRQFTLWILMAAFTFLHLRSKFRRQTKCSDKTLLITRTIFAKLDAAYAPVAGIDERRDEKRRTTHLTHSTPKIHQQRIRPLKKQFKKCYLLNEVGAKPAHGSWEVGQHWRGKTTRFNTVSHTSDWVTSFFFSFESELLIYDPNLLQLEIFLGVNLYKELKSTFNAQVKLYSQGH